MADTHAPALSPLAGKPVPPAVLVTHVMVTKGNVCQYYPDRKCTSDKGIDFKFPQDAFNKYLASLHQSAELKDYQSLIPTN